MQLSPPSLQEGAVRDAAASALAGAQPPLAAAVRAQPLRAWARVRSPEALQRPLPAPGVVVARGGWLGRVRQWVQKLSVARSRVVQDQGAQRQAAVLLRPAPPGVQGTGVRWLRGMGLLSQRLQASVQRMRHHALAPLAAAARPVSVAATVAMASSTASTASASASASAATPASTPDADADARALAAVSAAVQQRLAAQAADKDGFTAALHQAFGDKFDTARAETLRQQALAGDFSWVPKVQVVSSQALADLSGTQAAGAAQGAYVQDSDTIYLSRELLHTDSAQAQRILMEEIGHGIDARINTSDAVGDEGEIFSKLMHGDKIGAAELAALQADNDHGMVSLNGRQVAVEYGWFKKLFKAVFGGIAKVVKAVVNGVVGLAKAAVNITIGVATFDLDRIKRGVKDGVNAVVTTVKTVAKAVVDTAKAVAKIAKEAFVKLMQSKLFATVLMICRFIPIPVVQLVVRIVDVVRAAYMVYQGVKNKSLSMVLGGVASLAGGAAKIAGSFGASLSTVQNITDVANAASKLSMAYNAVANKDLGSALGLLGGTLGGPNANPNLNTLVTAAGYAQQAVGIAQAVRHGDGLGALSGTLGLGASTLDEGSALRQDLAQAKEVVTGLQAAREIGRGNLDAAQSLAMGMDHAQQAGQQADTISAQQRQAQADAANRSALNEADKDLRSQPATQDDAAVADATDAADAADAADGTETTSAAGAGDSSGTEAAAAGSAARPNLTLQVARGQTLEGIARAHYGENWRAGLTQMVMDNGLKLNQWGSPILRAGDTLTLGDLSDRSTQDLQAMARAGGKLVAANSSGLQVKADLEERARQAAAQKAMEAQRMSIQGAAAASEDSFAGGGWFNVPAPASANGLDMRYQSRAAAQGVETLYRGMSFQDFVKAQANQGGFEPFGRTGYMSPNLDYIKGLEAGTSNPLLDLSVKVRYDMSAEAVRDIRSQAFTENRPAFESFPDNPKLKDRGSLAIEDVFTLKGETVTGVPRSGAAANKPVVELATEGSRVFNLGVGRNVADPLKETTFRWTVVESSNPAVEAGTTGFGARYASPAELRLQSGLGTVGKGLTVVAAGVDAYRMGEALGTGNKEVITQTGVNIAGGWTGALVMGKVGAESFAAAGCLTPLAAIPFVCAASPFVGGVVGGVLGYKGGSSGATWLLNKSKGN